MSLRSTTLPSARQTYCCFRRDRSSRCSMLNEIPELRAPENSFTGIEIKPKVRYPDQTEAAIFHPALEKFRRGRPRTCSTTRNPRKLAIVSLNYIQPLDAQSCPR